MIDIKEIIVNLKLTEKQKKCVHKWISMEKKEYFEVKSFKLIKVAEDAYIKGTKYSECEKCRLIRVEGKFKIPIKRPKEEKRR